MLIDILKIINHSYDMAKSKHTNEYVCDVSSVCNKKPHSLI